MTAAPDVEDPPAVTSPARRGGGIRAGVLLSAGTVFAFALLLAGAEIVLRLASPDYVSGVRGTTVYSEIYGWRLRPGFRGLLHDTPTTIDGEGRRFQPPVDHVGRTPVALLGDSITFGARVRDAETFSALLQSRSGRYRTSNFGVEGYGTDQELIRLQREALATGPRVVVLNVCITNDFFNNTMDVALDDQRTPKPRFVVSGDTLALREEHLRLSRLARGRQWLVDESHLFHRLQGLLPRRAAQRPRVFAGEAAASLAEQVDVTFRLIREAARVTRDAGTRFLVLVHPDEPAFAQRSPLLKRFCGAPLLDGIAVVDLGARYRAAGFTFDQVAFDYQGHLTARGHAVAADIVDTLLQEPEGTPHVVSCDSAPAER